MKMTTLYIQIGGKEVVMNDDEVLCEIKWTVADVKGGLNVRNKH